MSNDHHETIKCPHCGHDTEKAHPKCDHCGHAITAGAHHLAAAFLSLFPPPSKSRTLIRPDP